LEIWNQHWRKLKVSLTASEFWRTVFDVAHKQERIKDLEKEIQRPGLWQNKDEAVRITKELSDLQQEITEFGAIKTEEDLKKMELQVFLSGKYDRGNAILFLMAGAGGQDSQDWATMLLRMYQRYCERRGLKNRILEQSFGEAGGPEGRIGTKSATLEIKGKYAYGFLKKENGVHRLVRISPFNAQALRQTSFALAEVTPELDPAAKDVEINPADLKIDFYHASGPGGQYVNKRETAVRITHLPTGLVVSCQTERTQGENRETAMKILYAKILKLLEESREKEVSQLKGEKVSASWGNQIRSYVLHPYKMVKDLRTEVESSDPDKVLDGELDEFIEAEIKI